MPISRMQQPRQMYGLGSLVKSVTKGAKKVVSGAVDAVKDVAKSDLGKAALLLGGGYYLGGGQIPGLSKFLPAMKYGNAAGTGFGLGNILPNILNVAKMPGLAEKAFSMGTAGKIGIGIAGLSGLAGFMSQQGMSEEEIEEVSRDPEALKVYLRQYYSQLNPKAEPEDVEKFVQMNTAEYRADGGRIGFQQGGNFDFNQFLQDRTREAMQVEGIGQAIKPVVESNARAQAIKDLKNAISSGKEGLGSFLEQQFGMPASLVPGYLTYDTPVAPASYRSRTNMLNALTRSYMNQYSAPTAQYSAPTAGGTLTDSVYDQMRFAAPGQSGSFVEMQGGQYGGDGFSPPGEYGIVIDGKQYATEQEAIDDVGLERYNMFFADGGRIGYEKGTPEMGMIDPKKVKQAQTMIKMGADVSTISSITGLSEAQVNQIQQTQGKASGGRIGYGMGSLVSKFVKENPEIFKPVSQSKKVLSPSINGTGGMLAKFVKNNPEIFMNLNSEEDEEDRNMVAYGGRMGYAYGDRAEDNAIQASGVEGLPLNENPAGIKELDLRDSGGFIPPVGVKEKADDIPAMLSNNEFVFTADAVRGMGDGDVNKGAQRMYDMMKKLENGGRV
jgi:hypothetical protein